MCVQRARILSRLLVPRLVFLLAAATALRAQESEEKPLPWDTLMEDVHGYIDARGGARIAEDPNQNRASLGELRLQLDLLKYAGPATIKLRSDFLYDPVLDDHAIDLETGRGWIDLREANVMFSPLTVMDLKLGRQILTWGTGDMLFINDLFPKDWQSFFIGRDVEYLKAPSDAVMASFFWDVVANLDVVYTPRFDPDRYISGERISYWASALGARAGERAVIQAETPDEWFSDHELALRLYKTVKSYELAAYVYHGFWKSPSGVDMESAMAIFPALDVYGASVRGPAGKGIANLEAGYYRSRDDDDGQDPAVRNSEMRLLAGYERELMTDFTMGLQYYLEHMRDHGGYKAGLAPGQEAADENRHVCTLRLTRLLMNQNLTLSLFTYYSPSDQDAYARPMVQYKVTDAWMVTAGGNLFFGSDPHTFFGQFEDNNNLYAGMRYSF